MQDLINKISLRMTEIENSLKANSSASGSSDEKKRVSPKLSKMVGTIHEGLDEEESQFKPNLGSKDQHNQSVKKRIAEEIELKIGNSFSKIEIDKAIQRYFDSRRRLWRETNDADQLDRVSKQNKSRRHRARKVRLYNRRKKVVHTDSEEARCYEHLTLDFMSEESSESDNEDMTVHRPVWCSRTLNMFLEELDKRAEIHQKETKKHVPERRNRRLGSNIESNPPVGAHKWMINSDWLKEHPDYQVAD